MIIIDYLTPVDNSDHRGAVPMGHGAASCEMYGPRWPHQSQEKFTTHAGILLELDAHAPVCAASRIVFCQMSLSTQSTDYKERARVAMTVTGQ